MIVAYHMDRYNTGKGTYFHFFIRFYFYIPACYRLYTSSAGIDCTHSQTLLVDRPYPQILTAFHMYMIPSMHFLVLSHSHLVWMNKECKSQQVNSMKRLTNLYHNREYLAPQLRNVNSHFIRTWKWRWKPRKQARAHLKQFNIKSNITKIIFQTYLRSPAPRRPAVLLYTAVRTGSISTLIAAKM